MEVDGPSTATSPATSSKPSGLSVAGSSTSVMAAPGTVGSVTLAVHPLVIMNISEHWTRVRAQTGSTQNVLGAIIGKQKGRHLELMNSFEVVSTELDGQTSIDMDFFRSREGQYKEVFSDLEFLGWYTTGDAPDNRDVHVHQQMCMVNESPVLLKLNTNAKHQEKLPISLYESVIDIVAGEAKMLFIQLNYTLATEEAERIGVDHVARLSRAASGAQSSSVVTEQLTAQYGAIKMLFSRLRLILHYMNAVKDGELPSNREVLREIKSLCGRLPVMNTDKFRSEFLLQCNDVALIAYLGTLTKTSNVLNQLINKLNVMHERGLSTKRMKGMFI